MATAPKVPRVVHELAQQGEGRVMAQSARRVRAGVASARLGRRVGAGVPVDLAARREARDAERWLDEGGSFSDDGEAGS